MLAHELNRRSRPADDDLCLSVEMTIEEGSDEDKEDYDDVEYGNVVVYDDSVVDSDDAVDEDERVESGSLETSSTGGSKLPSVLEMFLRKSNKDRAVVSAISKSTSRKFKKKGELSEADEEDEMDDSDDDDEDDDATEEGDAQHTGEDVEIVFGGEEKKTTDDESSARGPPVPDIVRPELDRNTNPIDEFEKEDLKEQGLEIMKLMSRFRQPDADLNLEVMHEQQPVIAAPPVAPKPSRLSQQTPKTSPLWLLKNALGGATESKPKPVDPPKAVSIERQAAAASSSEDEDDDDDIPAEIPNLVSIDDSMERSEGPPRELPRTVSIEDPIEEEELFDDPMDDPVEEPVRKPEPVPVVVKPATISVEQPRTVTILAANPEPVSVDKPETISFDNTETVLVENAGSASIDKTQIILVPSPAIAADGKRAREEETPRDEVGEESGAGESGATADSTHTSNHEDPTDSMHPVDEDLEQQLPEENDDDDEEEDTEEMVVANEKGLAKDTQTASRRWGLAVAVLLLMAVVTVVTVVVLTQTDSSVAPSPAVVSAPTPAPTMINTMIHTPSDRADGLLSILKGESFDNGSALNSVTSHQYRAFLWLLANSAPDDWHVPSLVTRYALAAFFYSTGGENWVNNQLWLSNKPYCTWQWVTCSAQNHIQRLEMKENNLIGTIPKELAHLSGRLGTNAITCKTLLCFSHLFVLTKTLCALCRID